MMWVRSDKWSGTCTSCLAMYEVRCGMYDVGYVVINSRLFYFVLNSSRLAIYEVRCGVYDVGA